VEGFHSVGIGDHIQALGGGHPGNGDIRGRESVTEVHQKFYGHDSILSFHSETERPFHPIECFFIYGDEYRQVRDQNIAEQARSNEGSSTKRRRSELDRSAPQGR
ncbi:MAG: hypothetical protein ABW224_14380, partial [Kibdelosporangium sp.]